MQTPSGNNPEPALFGGEDLDLDAKHPADVPVGDYPAPSTIIGDTNSLPFREGAAVGSSAADDDDDPFADDDIERLLSGRPLAATTSTVASEPLASPVSLTPPLLGAGGANGGHNRSCRIGTTY